MNVTDDRCDKALKYLISTDEGAAIAKSYMLGVEKQEKTILAVAMLESQEKTAGLREAEARASDEYQVWQKSYENAVLDYEHLRNKRNSESLVIECWRSINANRRKGNI